MEIIKIIFIGIVGTLIFIYLKNNNSELSGLSAIATSILIIILTVGYIVDTVKIFSLIAERTGISQELFTLIVKIISISYLSDFTYSFCEDAGAKSIGEKVNFTCKIIILVLSAPIINNIFNVISSLVL